MAALRLVNTGTAERAQVTDVPAMKQIIDYYAKQNRMLFRSLAELYGGIRDYVVWRQDGTVAGCCALHVMWKDLAEVRGLAVLPEYQGQGIGRQLGGCLCGRSARTGHQDRVHTNVGADVLYQVRISAGRTGYALNQGMAGVLPLSQILEVRRNRHDTHVAGVTAPADIFPAEEVSKAGR